MTSLEMENPGLADTREARLDKRIHQGYKTSQRTRGDQEKAQKIAQHIASLHAQNSPRHKPTGGFTALRWACCVLERTEEDHLADNPMTPTPAILRLKNVQKHLSMSRSAILARIAANDFPPAIELGTRAIGWRVSDLDAWVSSRVRGHQTVAVQQRGQ